MKNTCKQVVVENFFEPCILFLLQKNEGYGYEIQRQLKDNCSCNVNIGNLYRCLARLERQGCIIKSARKSAIGPRRFIYAITPRGRKLLASWIEGLESEVKIINSLISSFKKLKGGR